MANLKNSFRPVYIIGFILFLGTGSCKTPTTVESDTTQNQKSNTEDTRRNDVVYTDSGVSQLYLMVRLVKTSGSDVPGVIGVERSITKKQGNPLPVPGNGGGAYAFKCDLIGIDDSIVSTSTQNASYEYGEGKNEAILKFILPVAKEIKEAIVSYKTKDGAWEVLVVEELQEL